MFKRQKKDGAASSKDKGKRKARDKGNANPFGIIFRDEDQKSRFTVLAKRKIIGTRYIDDYTLDTLGLREDIRWMVDRLGWAGFLTCNYPTYPRITLEILSSLEVEVVSRQGTISFRLFNNDHKWTMEEFNTVFDFPLRGDRNIPRTFHANNFWRDITDDAELYDPSRSKASAMPNPHFRYFHRVMANTIFGRGESDGVVRNSELMMMWAAIEEVKIDSGSYFARHLMKVGRGTSGSIVIGGLLTRIATILGCDLDSLESVKRSPRIDLESCIAMKWVTKEDGMYCLVMKDHFALPLPDPERTSIQNRANWRMRNIAPTPLPMDLPSPPPIRHEPPRQSFSAGPSSGRPSFAGPSFAGASPTGPSAFDFSEFRSSFEKLQSDLAEQRDYLHEQSRVSEDRYRRVEQFMQRTEDFYGQAEAYFRAEEEHRQRQQQQWEREEEHRATMYNTSQQLDEIYSWHEELGNVPNMPKFPPPPPY